MANIARRSEEWHLNRDWMVLLVAVVLVAAVKLGLSVPWDHALPASVHTGAQFAPKVALAGLLVGFLVGLTGMGSGSLMAPVLIFLLHVKPSLAVGSDLVYASITKAFGAFQHYKQDHVDLTLTRWLAFGSVPGAIIGAQSVQWLQQSYGDAVQTIILRALGATFIVASGSMLARTLIKRRRAVVEGPIELSNRRKVATVALGLGCGYLVGLTSVGSGSLLVTALVIFYPLSATRLVGTDVFHALLLTTAAGASHLFEGNVDLVIVSNLLLGSVPGIVIGSKLVSVAPEKLLRTVLSIVLVLTGFKMLLG